MSGQPRESGPALRVSVRREGRAHVVSLSGSAGMDVAQPLEDQLLQLVDEQTPNLIVDLSGLTFISSIGISALAAADARTRKLRGATRLVNPSAQVAHVLALTRFDRIIGVHPTIDAAVASLPPAP